MNYDAILIAYKEGKLTKAQVQQKLQALKNEQPELSPQRYPLSEGQKGLWMLQKMNPEMDSYNLPFCFRIDGKVDVELFREALRFTRKQHPILTTTIVEENGLPQQQTNPEEAVQLKQETISCSDEELFAHIREKIEEPFALDQGPLMRTHLFTRSETEHYALITLHHMLFDGSSLVPFFTTLLDAYQELIEGKTPSIQPSSANYGDFVEWEQNMLKAEVGEEHRAYWKKQLAGSLPTLELPKDRPWATESQVGGKTHQKTLTPKLSDAIRYFLRSKRMNPSILFLGLFKLLLYRYTRQNDIIVGMPTMGRSESEFEKTIGYFINMIAIRSGTIGEQPFNKYLEELQLTVVEGLDHAAYPFPNLVRDLKVPRNESNLPVFQVSFVYQNFLQSNELNDFQERCKGPLPIEFVEGIYQQGEYELELEVFESESDGFLLNMKYNGDLFDSSTIERMMNHYEKLMEGVIKNPALSPGDYPIMTENEATELSNWNATDAEYPKEYCIHELFEKQAKETPDAIALTFEETSLTYRELDEKSTQLGLYLQQQGVGPDCLVGICIERSLEMVIAILGILKAGGAYAPLDPEYPEDRLEYMVEDSDAPIVLTQQKLTEKVATLISEKTKSIALDSEWETIVKAAEGKTLKREVKPNNMAYVIYTSGSTGQPKGVMLDHQPLVNRIIWMQREYNMTPDDQVLQKTPFSFDVSGWEFHWPLITGARLVMALPEKHKDPDYLKTIIQKEGITTLHFVPSMLQAFLVADDVEACTSIKRVICSGEALTVQHKNLFFEKFKNQELHNLYGPTEAAIDVTYWECEPEAKLVPIGKPIENIQLYVINEKQQQCPVGIPGELCIAGDGLARGYRNKQEQTEKAFIDNPFTPGTKLYRTGDLTRWMPDGNIEYLGRIDHQVKLRGFRIELGEIESQLVSHPEIQSCVVLVKEQDNNKQLIAWYVSENPNREKGENDPLAPQRLRDHLNNNLPEYMVPSGFVELETIPLTPNGKVDRKALLNSKLVFARAKKSVAARSETEQEILKIWKELLATDEIGVEDSFFDVGGDSILAVTLADRIKKTFDADITVTTLFEHKTVSEISRLISDDEPVVEDFHEEQWSNRDDVESPDSIDQQKNDTGITAAQFEKARQTSGNEHTQQNDIAIIGMAGRFPKANDLETFWNNIKDGRNCIEEIPKDRWNWESWYGDPTQDPEATTVKWGGFIEGVDRFDPLYFGIAPKDAAYMDPQQRLLLTTIQETLDNAGITPKALAEDPTGVFIAAGPGEYQYIDRLVMTAVAPSVIPNYISYLLNLRGPSECCETACSSALVALHRAIHSIQRDECEQAIVGAVNLLFSPSGFHGRQLMGLLSEDGKSQSFQADASGHVRSEGVGAILIKPLQNAIKDRDIIHAVIKGTGVAHGGRAMSLTAPNAIGMKTAITQAYTTAGIDPSTVSYIEAHGTASTLGDSIEIEALKSGYREISKSWNSSNPETNNTGENSTNGIGKSTTCDSSVQTCYISTLKPTIGHGEMVSGMAALLKTVAAIQNQTIPGIPGLEKLNEHIDLSKTNFQITAENHQWQSQMDSSGNQMPRRAAINSYGSGGVNAHAILEEYQPKTLEMEQSVNRTNEKNQNEVITLSARNEDRLQAVTQKVLDFVESNKAFSLSDFAYTLQTGRESMEYRLALVVNSRDSLIEALKARLSGKESKVPTFIGNTEEKSSDITSLLTGKTGTTMLKVMLAEKDLEKLALCWTKGSQIPWQALHTQNNAKRIPLPAYPFAQRTYPIKPLDRTGTLLKESKHNSPLEGGRGVLLSNNNLESNVTTGQTNLPNATQSNQKGGEKEDQKPITDNRKLITDIVIQTLGLTPEELNPTKPLSSYGFDSISFITLLQQLQAKIDPTITLAGPDAFQTTEELINLVVKRETTQKEKDPKAEIRQKYPELIHLNQSTEGRPVFWIHSGQGGVETYQQLAQKSKRPFYGIQAKGFMSEETPIHGIESMASYYTEIIRAVQPEGPYDVGGYSLGGMIAYEITRQLQKVGETVETIVMLDAIDSTGMKKINLSEKTELLQAINTALGASIQQNQEKSAEILIHRDEIDATQDEEALLQQLIKIAKERGLKKSESQLRRIADQNRSLQQAYDANNYKIRPLPDPENIACHYLRNKGGLYLGELAPYCSISPDEITLDKTNYWQEWQNEFLNFQIQDLNAPNHMTLLVAPESKSKILNFCQSLYK